VGAGRGVAQARLGGGQGGRGTGRQAVVSSPAMGIRWGVCDEGGSARHEGEGRGASWADEQAQQRRTRVQRCGSE